MWTQRMRQSIIFSPQWTLFAAVTALWACASPVGQPQQTAQFSLDNGSPWVPPGDAVDGQKSKDGKTAAKDVATKKDTALADVKTTMDAGAQDAAASDTAVADTGAPDTGVQDSSVQDAGASDVGPPDVGVPDTGLPDIKDAGAPDVGQPDANKPTKDTYVGVFGADVPWGSDPDVSPYDAGQWNYDIKGGGTAGPGPGLCAPHMGEVNIEKKVTGGKVDIIIFVDTSGSMGQEAKWTNNQMNNFANYLVQANIDYRVILAEQDKSCCKMCILPPLGGNNCGNNPPLFMHHKSIYISSTNGLIKMIQTYNTWSPTLRKDATKNFLAVTDDNSYKNAQYFDTEIKKLHANNGGQFLPTKQVPFGYVFHSIVAYNSKADCPTLAKKGTVYLQLMDWTKGAKFKICDQNWTPIFKELAKAVSQTAKPGCTYPMKKPAGVSSASDLIISYHDQKTDFDVSFAKGNTCPPNGVGYIFDNKVNPSQVTLCPASCSKLSGGGDLLFNYGCM